MLLINLTSLKEKDSNIYKDKIRKYLAIKNIEDNY